MVLPEQDAVIAITSGTDNLQDVLDAVWEHLLPAMKPQQNLPAKTDDAGDLAVRLSKLIIAPPVMQAVSPLEAAIGGMVYNADVNTQQWLSFSYSFSDHQATATIQTESETHVIQAGRGIWKESFTTVLEGAENRVMSSFTWLSDNILQFTLQFVEAPFRISVDAVFEGSTQVVLTQRFNVSAGQAEETVITGRLNHSL